MERDCFDSQNVKNTACLEPICFLLHVINMLSFVHDSVGRAYAALKLKLSIIKQEWYQKVPQHNNWKTSMHRLHLSLGGEGACTDICETSRKSTRQGFVLFLQHPKHTPTKLQLQSCFLCVVDINFFGSFCSTL